jgi:hypothetical protein
VKGPTTTTQEIHEVRRPWRLLQGEQLLVPLDMLRLRRQLSCCLPLAAQLWLLRLWRHRLLLLLLLLRLGWCRVIVVVPSPLLLLLVLLQQQ